MKFSFETVATTDPTKLWDLYSDISKRKIWDTDLQSITLDGGFTEGSKGEMVMGDGQPMPYTLVWVDRERGFRDETIVPRAGAIYFSHEFEPAPEGKTLIRHSVSFKPEGRDDSLEDMKFVSRVFEDVPESVFKVIAAAQ